MSTSPDLAALAAEIDNAWASRDVDAILALHHPDGTFQMVGETQLFEGQEALRAVFGHSLSARPDLTFECRNLILGADHIVVEGTMRAGQHEDGTWALDRPYVDVFAIRDGKIWSKTTYAAPVAQA